MPRPRNTAIVLAGVNVLQMPPHFAVSAGDVLLFDIGVESVEQHPDIGMADLIAKRHRIVGDIQKISLEAIQRLDRDGHAVLRQHWPQRLVTIHRPLPLVGSPPPAGQIADR